MRFKSFTASLLASAAAALVLTACDRQATKPARNDGAIADATGQLGDKAARKAAKRAAREAARGGRGDAAADDAVGADAGVSGSVRWAANRKNSAQEQVAKQFRRNGSDFGATSADDYAAKVNAFVSSPPAGVKTATRGNGDKLFYDPASNTFAVVNRRGLPKTMFKPEEGGAYWQEQLAELNNYGKGRRQARRGAGGDDAG